MIKSKRGAHFLQKPMVILLVALMLSVLMLVATPRIASAAQQTQDGLKVTVTTDKTKYRAGGAIKVNVSVENTNGFPVDNVKLNLALPKGIRLTSASASIHIGTLAAGATSTQSFTARANGPSAGLSPQTGDITGTSLWFVLLFVFAGVLLALFFYGKKHKGAKYFSFFLCFVFLLVLVAPTFPVQAAVVSKSVDTVKTITVAKTKKRITVKTSYNWNDTSLDVTGVSLDSKSITNFDKDKKQTKQLTAIVAPATAANKSVTWQSSAPTVASVDANGLVTAKAVGTATITATTAEGGFTATCTVTVGSKSASNAEAAKITGFTLGTNTANTLVFKMAGYENLSPGVTLNFVDVKTGAASPGTTVDLGAKFSNGVLSLSTQKTVDTIDPNYVGVTYTVTCNGVVSNQVNLNVSSLFGPGTTTGKLRHDNAAILALIIDPGNLPPGTTTIPLKLTLSSGVSMPSQNSISNPPGVSSATISAPSGGELMINAIGTPVNTGEFVFPYPIMISCGNSSYQVNREIRVVIPAVIQDDHNA